MDNLKKDVVNSGIVDRFSVKGNSFRHENEIRAFVVGVDNTSRYNVANEDGSIYAPDIIPVNERKPIKRDENGIYVKVDLNYFIEKVYVSPFSPNWFVDLVKTITKNYGLPDNVVEKSTLYDKPKTASS